MTYTQLFKKYWNQGYIGELVINSAGQKCFDIDMNSKAIRTKVIKDLPNATKILINPINHKRALIIL